MSEDKAAEIKATREKFEAEVKAENAKLSGKGMRWFVGSTRGKNTQVIKYQAFDESLPDTLPVSVQEFAEITQTAEESQLVKYLIIGKNDDSYTQASDPIAEFINPVWPDEIQTLFRNSVRSYAKMVGVPVEDAVTLIKPGLDAKFAASQAQSTPEVQTV